MDNRELQGLYRVRELAVRKDQCEDRIRQLRGQLQGKQALHEMQEENSRTTIGGSRYILIFVAVYIVSALVLNKVFSVVIRIVMDGIPFVMAVEAALVADVNPLAGMVLALPFALAATLIMKAVLWKGDRERNSRNREANRIGGLQNQRILQQNAVIEEQNRHIMEQTAGIEAERARVIGELHATAPWYPEAYFSVPAVDYMIQRLETRQAENLNQAIVHYEAGLR